MKTSTINFWQITIGLVPLIYLAIVWNKLPQILPVHYNINFTPDRFGSKFEILLTLLLIQGLAIGLSFVIRNLNKFDPKNKSAQNGGLTNKLSWVLVLFMSLTGLFMIYQSLNYGQKESVSGKYEIVGVCLFLAVLGNFMNNLKPNYFVGIRTPWSLDNDENWKKTHHLGSRLFFFGGLFLSTCILLLPSSVSSPVLIVGLSILALIPIIYSYILFRQQKSSQ